MVAWNLNLRLLVWCLVLATPFAASNWGSTIDEAGVHARNGEFNKSLALYESTLAEIKSSADADASNGDGEANLQIAQIYLGMAQVLVQTDRFQPSLQLFETLLKMEITDPGYEAALKGSALAGYTIALTKVGRFKQAERVAKQARVSVVNGSCARGGA